MIAEVRLLFSFSTSKRNLLLLTKAISMPEKKAESTSATIRVAYRPIEVLSLFRAAKVVYFLQIRNLLYFCGVFIPSWS